MYCVVYFDNKLRIGDVSDQYEDGDYLVSIPLDDKHHLLYWEYYNENKCHPSDTVHVKRKLLKLKPNTFHIFITKEEALKHYNKLMNLI